MDTGARRACTRGRAGVGSALGEREGQSDREAGWTEGHAVHAASAKTPVVVCLDKKGLDPNIDWTLLKIQFIKPIAVNHLSAAVVRVCSRP